jgi:hypothetical protein
VLTASQVDEFVEKGFLRIDHAFPRAIADAGLPALWRAIGCDANDPATWTRPVVRVWPENDRDGSQPISFRAAANTTVLHEAFDKLVGLGRWRPRPNVGTVVVRFPSQADPGDLGWHIDLSYPAETGDRGGGGGDYSDWRVNVRSRDRALLMRFLFSDVGRRTRQPESASVPTTTSASGAFWRGRYVSAKPCRNGRRPAHRTGHGGGWDRIPVSPVPDSCGPAASWAPAAIHGPASLGACGASQS